MEFKMKKAKTLFLFSVLITAGLLLSACTQSASSGEVTPQDDSQLQEILDAVANQTPAAPADDGTGGSPSDEDNLQLTQTAEAGGVIVEPATPTPSPTPTLVPVDLDLVVPDTYTLKKGEFPWCLARRFNVDAVALLNANGLSASGSFKPGQQLTIPKNAGTFDGGQRSLVNHPATYTVKSGDTFYSIACHYGDVWPEEIAAQNNMSLSDTLTAGTTLNIP
jgi:LysM repeat protein